MPYVVTPVVDPKRLARQQPEIEAGDLLLRRWTLSDATQLLAAFADREIQQWNLRTVVDLDEARKLIGAWKHGWRRHTAVSWAVVRPADRDRVLGQVGFRALYPVDGMAEVSYWVVPGQRQQGVASRATRALADWAVDDLHLERLELVHSTRNQASCRVAEAAGFEAEGTKRHLQKHVDGWHDMHLHARIREDRTAQVAPLRLRARLAARIERSPRVGDAGGRPALMIG